MAYPEKYTRLFDYEGYQNANPTRPLPGVRVNIDLNDLKRVTSETIDFLGTSLTSSGTVKPNTIGLDQLTAEAIGELAGGTGTAVLLEAEASAAAAEASATEAAAAAASAALSAEAAATVAKTFETVADVEAASIGVNVVTVHTLGYSEVGDGGGATYDSVASEPAHAGKIQSDDGRWWEIVGTVFSVRQFGAVGDGSDETTVLQAAIDSGVKTLYWPPGEYGVGAAGLAPADGQTWVTSGRNVTTIKALAVPTTSLINITSKSHVVIKGFTFDYQNQKKALTAVIGITQCTHCDVSDNRILDLYAYGIAVQSSSYIKTNDNYIERTIPSPDSPAATVTPSATTGSITLTANTAIFDAADVGSNLRINDGYVTITGFTDSTHLTGTVGSTLSSTSAATSGNWTLGPWSNGIIYFGSISQPLYCECNFNTLVNAGPGGSVGRSQIMFNRVIGSSGALIFTNASVDDKEMLVFGNLCVDGTTIDPIGFPHNGIESWSVRSVVGANIVAGNAGAGITVGGKKTVVVGNNVANNGSDSGGSGIALVSDGGTNHGTGSVIVGNNADIDGGSLSDYGFTAATQSEKFVVVGNNFNSNATANESITTDSEPYTFVGRSFKYSFTWNPGSIAAGGYEEHEETFLIAELGDEIQSVSFSLDTQGIILNGRVNSAGHVKVVAFNPTAGAINLGSGTIRFTLAKAVGAGNT